MAPSPAVTDASGPKAAKHLLAGCPKMPLEQLWADMSYVFDVRGSAFLSQDQPLHREITSVPYRETGFPTLTCVCEKLSKVLAGEANQNESADRTDHTHNPSALTTDGGSPLKPSKEVSSGTQGRCLQRPPHLLQTWAFPAVGPLWPRLQGDFTFYDESN